MAGLSMAGKVVMEPRSAFCQVMVVMFLRVVTSHAQGVLYNETCVEGLHDSCVTTNAVCRNTGEGLKCMCSEEEIYVKPNDTCVEKLDVDFTNIDVNISSVNSTSCFVTITTTTNGTLYDEYIVELQSPVSLEKRTFSTNQFRLHELLSGTKYNMSLWVAKAGISSKSSKSFQEVVATIPSTPVNVRIPKELVYEKNFTLLLSVPDQRFHYVFVQANSANTVKRYFFIRDSTIGNISVVIDGLLAATYYTVLTQTVDKNNVSYSAISDIITSNTAPVLPFVSTRVRCIYFKRLITEFSFSLVNVNYIAYLNNTIVEFDRYGNWMVYRIPHDGSCEAVYVFKIFSTLGNISSEGYALETMHLCPSLPSLSISNRTTNSFQLNVLAACQVSKMTASGYCLGYDYNRTRDNAVYEITSNEISDRMFKFVHSQSQQGAYCHFSVTLFKTVSSYIITGHTGSIETTLLRGVPDPMYDLSLRIVAATHAWIWWKNPVMRNGQIWGITGNVISDEDNTCVIEYSQNIMRCRYQQSLILYHIISYDINQSLNITNLQPYKNYSFTIRYVGMSSQVSRDATLKFQTLESIPSFVQNISMSFIGAQNATVKWVEPSNINGLLTCFYIELVNDSSLYRNTDNWNITLKIQPNARVMLLRDLLPYTNYSVRVSAQNVAWNGSYNQTVEFRTHIGVPDTPTGITIGQVLSSMIEVKWNISGYYSGPTRFAINGEDAFNGSIMYTNITRIGWSTDELENQSMLTGLAPFWNYSVTVRAETVDGQLKHISEQSSPIIVQTKEDVPGFVQNISMSYIGAQNASIKWVEPRNINGLLTCFYIELVNVSSLYRKTDNWNNTLKIQPNAREMLLHFLLPYTNYSVQVKAQNVAMNGSYNEVVKFRTRIGVSDIPTGITIRRVSSSMIEVKWNNSGYYSGPTRFVITATDSINRSITFTNVTSIGWWTDELENQSILTGLAPFWNYSVTVRAETVDGQLKLISEQSSPIIVQTKEDVPGFVQNISMSYIGAQNASIKWVEPRNINGLLTCFYIELVNVSSLYRKTDNWNNTLKIQPNAREMLLHYLLPYTNYSVQVKAQNVAMNGSYNEVVKFRTRIGVSDIPTGITIRRVSSSMIEVKWNNSGYYSGPTRFVITATDSVNRSITFTNVTSIGWWTDELENQSMLTGLAPFWNYSVTVRAETVDGQLKHISEQSSPIIVQTKEDVPGFVQNISMSYIGAQNASIKWVEPRNINGLLTCFYIELVNVSSLYRKTDNWNNTLKIQPNAREMLLHFLLPYTNYSVQVKAQNVAMNGSYNEVVKFRTRIGVSDIPTGITIRRVSSSMIEVKWNNSGYYSGPTRFVITATDSINRSITFTNVTSIGWWTDELENQSILTGLAPFWNYSVTVRAETVDGQLKLISEQSSPIIVQTKEDVPGFVQNISMSYIGAQNASIKWVEPRNINGLLTCFYIELVNVSSLYRKTDNWNNTLKIQPNAREMLLHYLLPYTNYSVQVKAQNVAMNGSYNEVVKFRTRIGVSDIPTGITIRRVSSSMIEVKWNNSGYYSGPTRFVITATDSVNRSITFTNVTSIGWWTDEMEHQSMLTGLNSLWNYSVTVRAETVDGDLQLLSNPSPPIIVFTEEDETEINSESPKQNGHCDFWTNTQVVEPYALCASFITKMADVAPEMSCEGKEFHYSLKEAARIVNMLNLQVVNTTTLQQQMTGPLMEEPVEKKNTQLQMDVIQKLSKIKSQHACSVMALIYSLNTVIRRKENITPEIQKKALEIYKSLLDSYKNTSADVPTHIVEHIAQTLVTGTVMMMDFTEHESDKTVLKESAAVLINIIDNVMDILQNNKETNAPASDIVTSEAYIKVAKLSPDKINGNTLNEVMKSGLHFPPNMNLTQDSGGSITMQYLYIQKNPYNWGESSDLVTTPVQSISFKDEQNKKINVSNLTEPVRITIPITRKSLTNQMKNIPIRLNILKRNTSWTLYPKMSHSCVGTFHVSLQKNMLLSMIFTLPGKVKSINLGIGKNRIVDKSSVFDKPFKYPSDIPIIDNLYGLHSDEDMTAEFENTTMFGDAFEFKNCAFFCSIYLGRCCSANVSECWEIYDYCNERGLVNVSHHCLAVLQETHMIKTMNKTQTNQNSIKQILLTMYNSDEKLNKTGSYLHIGVGLDIDIAEVREIISERNKECLGNQTAILCFAEVEVNISVSVNSLGCLYWDEEIEDWTSNGLQVGQLVSLSNANDTSYECITTHLSSFSGSVQMASIFIDPFGDAVLFITFFENPVLVTTVILVWVLYFFLLYWARNSDKKDLERVGVVNCKDNLQSEEYLYLVCIVTGWWKQAGTTANVYINMTGSEGVSGRKCLTHAGRQCFQAGYEDWFLITTTKCLGNIKSVTLWHDGTGDSPQWYLNHVNVRDVQTRNSWTFIYNDWLAVDGDAFWQISATIKAVTEEETRLKTKYNFMIQSSRGIRDGHLWLSIFTKAPMSTFTRVQRLTCALSLLLTTMLTNLIFYGVPTDDPAQQVQDGAFRLSFSQIVIGIESSLIMFPVNLIIILLFIKVKPKSRKSAIKPSFGSADIHAMTDSCVVNITRIFNHSTMHNPASVLTAVKQSHNHSNLRLFHDKFCELKGLKFCLDPNLSVTKFVKNVGTLYLPLATETTIMEKNVDDAGSFSMSENKGSGTEDAESSVSFGALPSSFPSRDSSVCQHKGRTQSAKQHKDTFSFSSEVASDQDKMRSDAHIRTVIDVPVGIRNDSRILSWWFIYIAWFVAIGTCFVSSYFVVLYGLKFGYAHSAALLVSFLTGLVQSIFVLLPIKVLCTAVLLTLIFKTPAEFDDIDGPRAMDDDQEYLKNVTEEPAFHHNLRTQLPARLLKSIRRRLRLDWIMDVNIRNIIIHFAYMSIVILMSTCQINISNSYATSLSVRNMFVNNKFGVPLKNQVSSREGMFSYLHKTVSPLMMTMSETGERNLSITTEFFLVGGYRLRQARISKDKCRPPISMENIPSGCQPAYSTFMEDRNRYNMSWDNLIDAAYNSTWINLTANRKDPWSYQPALSLRTMPFVGLFDTYSGGGYVQEMAALEDPTGG
ncbi:uncharacterized protein LOC127860029 isoform X6 [Dreissena polymorpha]|uniref:uncharacterized protein LOC127860029 isoform X6 n=1 Tax=Dreissena polymorpha TaxID=45954 RepID=UPI0022650E9D|nr:uncharacterized protein LOC127860029 isoform X6 [Dreissena polymorpha]